MRELSQLQTPTGNYRIEYFNNNGDFIPGCSLNTETYSKALELGLDNLPKIAISFKVIRVIYNSLDDKEGTW